MANLNLSQRDIEQIAKLVDTEVPSYLATKNPAEYERMVQAVFDTVTNRVVSPQFPNTVAGVANQRSQFSKINGPSYLNPYGSVDRAPKASQRAQNAVYDYAAARSAGAPATAPNSLNYANPNYSSKSNVAGWISDMIDAGAEKFGIGKSVHYHGLAPGTQPVGPYGVAVAGMPTGPVPTPTAKPETIFSNVAARTVEKAPIQDIAPDLARPDTPFSRATSVSSPMANPFDWGRMAAPTTTPSALTSFNTDRFGPTTQVAQGMTGLKAAMSPSLAPDTPLARANYPTFSPEELLALDVAEANPGRAAAQAAKSASYQAAQAAQAPKTYVDPTVATAYAQQPAAGNAGSRAIDRQTTGAMGFGLSPNIGPDASSLNAQMRSMMAERELNDAKSARNKSTMLGGLLGTAVAGPLGGLLGGIVGRQFGGRSVLDQYPDAPAPSSFMDFLGQLTGGAIGGRSLSYEGLSSDMKDAYNSSPQVRDIVDNNKQNGLF